LTELERLAMKMLLSGDDPELEVLRAQWATASVAVRDLTGAGFFTSFRVDRSLEAVGRSMWIEDVMAEAVGVTGPIKFILYVEHGFIDTLEGWTVGAWNVDDPSPIRAFYMHRVDPDGPMLEETPSRDLTYALHDPYLTKAERASRAARKK
jgi:hypothetical protein